MSHQDRSDDEAPQREPKRRKSAEVIVSSRKSEQEQNVRKRGPETSEPTREKQREVPNEQLREPVNEKPIEPIKKLDDSSSPKGVQEPDNIAEISNFEEDDLSLNPEIIDEAFSQIQMCDEDDKSFSRSIVMKYFEQAEETFPKLQRLYQEREMKSLSETGHFLKSSSAVIGIRKVKDACEKIQHYASLKDLQGNTLSKEQAIELLKPVLESVESKYYEAKTHLMRLYE